MNNIRKYAAAIVLVAGAVGVCATMPNASSEHFIVTNQNSVTAAAAASVLKLVGTKSNPQWDQVGNLQANETASGLAFSTPNIQIIRHGSDVCVFLGVSQKTSNDIAAFVYPGFALVGNYSDPNAGNTDWGAPIAVRGDYLFAGYTGTTDQTGAIGVWSIGPGCVLTLLNTTTTFDDFYSMGVTPDGKTLIVSYVSGLWVDSFSIGAGGTLTEHGKYGVDNGDLADDLDITADSLYVLFSVQSYGGYTLVDVFSINSDGSLGYQYSFGGDGSLGDASSGGDLWLSPDEKFLFVTSGGLPRVTSLSFSENPLNISYGGCIVTPKQGQFLGGMATLLPSGSGGALYLVDSSETFAGINVFAINSSTGCLREIPSSPFSVGSYNSVVAWPPRPF